MEGTSAFIMEQATALTAGGRGRGVYTPRCPCLPVACMLTSRAAVRSTCFCHRLGRVTLSPCSSYALVG